VNEESAAAEQAAPRKPRRRRPPARDTAFLADFEIGGGCGKSERGMFMA